MQGWLFRQTTRVERWLLILAGLALVYPRAAFDYIGIVLIAIVLVSQKLRRAESPAPAGLPTRGGGDG
jgi:TRAP-type uncharacterized transport system fused permease subunit